MNHESDTDWTSGLDLSLSWHREDMHFPQPLTPLTAAWQQIEMDSGVNYRHAWLGLPIRTHCRIVHGYVYIANAVDGTDTELAHCQRLAREKARSFARLTRQYWQRLVLPTLLAIYEWMDGALVENASLEEVALAWEELWEHVPMIARMHWKVNIGSYHAVNDLATLCESLLPDLSQGESLKLIQGQPNELQRVQEDLHALVSQARASVSIADAIMQHQAQRLEVLADLPGGREFLARLDGFLRTHGHLGPLYDEFALPPWRDEPALLLQEISKRLLAGHAEGQNGRRIGVAEGARTVLGRIRQHLRDRPADRQQFEDAFALAQDVGPLTEDHNYWLDRMLHAQVHRFANRVGDRLVQAGRLATRSDIFFLSDREVTQALRQPTDWGSIVTSRRTDHQRWSAVQPPNHLGPPPKARQLGNRFYAEHPSHREPHHLVGIGASPGLSRGPARVVLSSEDFLKVSRGDVLVCPSSNPSWVPLFELIGGLITNTGGALSHAAVIAREFGVPAVVGTGDATARIRDGQVVEVDGSAGVVTIAPGA